MRNLSPQYESEDASCLMKHTLQLEEQADEGVSHASELEDGEKVSVFHDLQEGARRLREQFRAKVDPSYLILEVRTLRKRAEVLDPSFNLEKCKACGAPDDLIERFKSENALNRKTYNHSKGEKRMAVSYREIGVVYGAQHLAKGAERGFEEIDTYMGKSALKPHERPSTWLNMGLGFGLPIITYLARRRIKTPWDLLLISAGGHMSTKVWDYAEEYATIPVTAAAMTRPRYVPTQVVTPTPSVAPAGRYVITG